MNKIKSITEASELEGKRVLVRVDWNVPITNENIQDDFRIQKSMATLNYLRDKGAKVIIATHLEPGSSSIDPLREYVPKDAELLDNLRSNPGEKNNDSDFAKFLASKADIYVNEAFSASHRSHASIVGVPEFIPGYAGIQFVEEIDKLSRMFKPSHPFILILGGAKFDTKLPLLKKFSSIADKIFVGGALAHNFFVEQGKNVGDSVVSEGEFGTNSLYETGKIILPENLLVKTHYGVGYDTINHIGSKDVIMDAGPKDVKKLEEIIKESQVILWNGPLGNYERGFVDATVELAKVLAESGKEVIVGGGDTLAAIKDLDLYDKFSFVSTGGGAMLDFLANETLPGIEALNQ